MNAEDVTSERSGHHGDALAGRAYDAGRPRGRKLNAKMTAVCLASFLVAGIGFTDVSTAHVGPEYHEPGTSGPDDGTVDVESATDVSVADADARTHRAEMRRTLAKFSRNGHDHRRRWRNKHHDRTDHTDHTDHSDKTDSAAPALSITTTTASADSDKPADQVTPPAPDASTPTSAASDHSHDSPPTTAARSTTTAAQSGGGTAPTPPPPDGELLPIYTPRPGCAEGTTVPRGQTSMGFNKQPLGSIWCFDLAPPPSKTAIEGPNSWVDDFTVNRQMVRFNDGDMGYRVFDNAGGAPGRSQHFINNNHWMVDGRDGFTGGSSLRPDRSFKFQNGKIVVEGDFASAIPEYGGETWGEITITSAPAPTGEIADILYAYGQFGGHWTVGCRLQGQYPVCAVEGAEPNDAPRTSQCQAIPGGYRVMEISFFLECGSVHSGGGPFWDEAKRAARQCQRNGPDMACRDRFRLEVTKSSLTLYVNGVKYFEDANWPAAHQLPDSFVNGEVYVYQSNWQHRASSHAFRYHWDHFAVNPPNGPEPSETFGG